MYVFGRYIQLFSRGRSFFCGAAGLLYDLGYVLNLMRNELGG
jgi:hypothetical protein